MDRIPAVADDVRGVILYILLIHVNSGAAWTNMDYKDGGDVAVAYPAQLFYIIMAN